VVVLRLIVQAAYREGVVVVRSNGAVVESIGNVVVALGAGPMGRRVVGGGIFEQVVVEMMAAFTVGGGAAGPLEGFGSLLKALKSVRHGIADPNFRRVYVPWLQNPAISRPLYRLELATSARGRCCRLWQACPS